MKRCSTWLMVTLAAGLLGGSAWAQQMRMGGERPMSSVPVGPAAGLMSRTPKLRTSVQNWGMTGTRTEAYEIRCDTIFTDCEIPILRTRPFASEPLGMGSLTHSESALIWRNQRLEVAAELKAGDIDGWAGVWMRIDDANGKVLAFDNMQNRPVRGTSAFAWYSVVLDVPADAARVTFGVFLHGPGAVFIRELSFQSIGKSKASTDLVGPLRASATGTTVGG